MNSNQRWKLSRIQTVLGLLFLGVFLACNSGEKDEKKITELMSTPVIADGTYQLDNLSLNDNGSLVSYGLTSADGNKWTSIEYTPLKTELRWLGDENCQKVIGEPEKCNEGTYQLTTSGSAYFFIENARKEWGQEAYIKDDNNLDLYFGRNIAMEGDTLVVQDSGGLQVFKRTGLSWAKEANIIGDGNESFGPSPFPITLDGDTLVVGAFYGTGKVYVLRRTGTSWALEALIEASNKYDRELFGFSVDLDGDTLAVGQPQANGNDRNIINGPEPIEDETTSSGKWSGSVFVYKRTGTSWAQEAYIRSDDPDRNNRFGQCITLEGDTLVVGEKGEPYHTFERIGNIWSRDARIYGLNDSDGSTESCDNTGEGSSFQQDIVLDNDTLVYTSDYHTNDGFYIRKRTSTNIGSSDNWPTGYKFTSPNNNDDFGRHRLELDGDILAVSASSDSSNQTTITTTASSNNDSSNSGAVYVYHRNPDNSSWALEAYIKATNNDASDGFGQSIALSGDTLAVGSHYEDSNQMTITNGTTASSNNDFFNSGAVYVYRYMARYKWSLKCPSDLTVQVVLNKNSEVLRSKKTTSGTCSFTDSPMTITPEDIKETWSKTANGFKRTLEVWASGVKYTRTYQYKKI